MCQNIKVVLEKIEIMMPKPHQVQMWTCRLKEGADEKRERIVRGNSKSQRN